MSDASFVCAAVSVVTTAVLLPYRPRAGHRSIRPPFVAEALIMKAS